MLALIRLNGWSHMELACLPAHLHNRPQRIPEAVRAKIRKASAYARILVLYGDCGTGGALDQVLAEEGVERIPARTATRSTAASTPFSPRPRPSPRASI